MRTFYFPFFLLLPFFLLAQSSNKTYVSLGINQAHAHLRTQDRYEIYDTNWSYRSGTGERHHSRGLGASLGISRVIHPRWEVAARLNYAAAKVQDTIGINFLALNLDLPQTRDRNYRMFTTEALVFWKLTNDRSLLEVQLGTGLAYLHLYQRYNSGFAYDREINLFTQYTTFAKTNHLGIPAHLQLQYPLNYNFKIGCAVQVNTYFKSTHQQSTLSAFVAYRW